VDLAGAQFCIIQCCEVEYSMFNYEYKTTHRLSTFEYVCCSTSSTSICSLSTFYLLKLLDALEKNLYFKHKVVTHKVVTHRAPLFRNRECFLFSYFCFVFVRLSITTLFSFSYDMVWVSLYLGKLGNSPWTKRVENENQCYRLGAQPGFC